MVKNEYYVESDYIFFPFYIKLFISVLPMMLTILPTLSEIDVKELTFLREAYFLNVAVHKNLTHEHYSVKIYIYFLSNQQ